MSRLGFLIFLCLFNAPISLQLFSQVKIIQKDFSHNEVNQFDPDHLFWFD